MSQFEPYLSVTVWEYNNIYEVKKKNYDISIMIAIKQKK